MDVPGVTNRFHRLILSWDYFELCDKAEEGHGVYDTLREVPTSFKDIHEYKAVFEPLLLEECGAQVLRGIEEGVVMSPHPAVVSNFDRKDEFLYVRMALEAGVSKGFMDNDLVLLCKDNPEADDCRVELHAMGFVEAHEGEQSVRLKFYVTDDSQAGNAKGMLRVKAMRSGLQRKESCWWLLRLFNMSTITREWIALQHAHLVPFSDLLVTGRAPQVKASKHMDIPAGMKGVIERQCNDSQMQALQAGLEGNPLVLIQGPPGTGKTRTILNLLSVVMHAAAKGSLELLQAGAMGSSRELLTPEVRHQLWQAQSPWYFGQAGALDAVRPRPQERGAAIPPPAAAVKIGKNMGPKAHVLVCAPSNSALDEIVMRIIGSGLLDKDGQSYTPSIVRIGVNIHHSVKGVSLEHLIDKRLGVDSDVQGGGGQDRALRERMRTAILDEANVVCSTLSFAGSNVFYRLSRKFDVVIIDEAAQAVEPSVLVPLVMGCRQAFLVGDPEQLPATVISGRATEYGYDTSLFKRLQQAGYPVKMLNVQYRMNPRISAFPSQQFYSGNLKDDMSVVTGTEAPWHTHPCFGPLAFYNVQGKETVPEGAASIVNKIEAEMVLCLYHNLTHAYPQLKKTGTVAVISPYKAQVTLLRSLFAKALGDDGAKAVDINTIDGFQGREKDVVLFSCVRSSKGPRKSIGFVADERRINVGLTRARNSMIIIGDAKSLQIDERWANLIKHCMSGGCFYNAKKPFQDYITKLMKGELGAMVATAADLAKVKPLVRKPKEGSQAEAAEEQQQEEQVQVISEAARNSKDAPVGNADIAVPGNDAADEEQQQAAAAEKEEKEQQQQQQQQQQGEAASAPAAAAGKGRGKKRGAAAAAGQQQEEEQQPAGKKGRRR